MILKVSFTFIHNYAYKMLIFLFVATQNDRNGISNPFLGLPHCHCHPFSHCHSYQSKTPPIFTKSPIKMTATTHPIHIFDCHIATATLSTKTPPIFTKSPIKMTAMTSSIQARHCHPATATPSATATKKPPIFTKSPIKMTAMAFPIHTRHCHTATATPRATATHRRPPRPHPPLDLPPSPLIRGLPPSPLLRRRGLGPRAQDIAPLRGKAPGKPPADETLGVAGDRVAVDC
jgi:hypothetical protein